MTLFGSEFWQSVEQTLVATTILAVVAWPLALFVKRYMVSPFGEADRRKQNFASSSAEVGRRDLATGDLSRAVGNIEGTLKAIDLRFNALDEKIDDNRQAGKREHDAMRTEVAAIRTTLTTLQAQFGEVHRWLKAQAGGRKPTRRP